MIGGYKSHSTSTDQHLCNLSAKHKAFCLCLSEAGDEVAAIDFHTKHVLAISFEHAQFLACGNTFTEHAQFVNCHMHRLMLEKCLEYTIICFVLDVHVLSSSTMATTAFKAEFSSVLTGNLFHIFFHHTTLHSLWRFSISMKPTY